MEIKNEYLRDLYRRVEKRDPNEPEFLQAVGEVLQSLAPVADRRPDLIDWGVFERIVEPERMITFRVSWVDDQGKVQVNRGYRVQYNSAIGPYKGGLRRYGDHAVLPELHDRAVPSYRRGYRCSRR